MIAYLVNQYPKISHTFIRREIRALEASGTRVLRLSIRTSGERFEDPADREEQAKTAVVIEAGAGALASAMARAIGRDPKSFQRAFTLAVEIARRSERVRPAHLAYLAEACWIREFLEAQGCTHLHAHFATNPASVAMLCRALGGPPWSFTLHGSEELSHLRELAVDRKIENAAFAVAISEYGRERMREICGASNRDKIHVVHCGLDRALLERAIAPVPEAPRITCVARLSKEKGHRVLLEAARLLAGEGRTFELVLIGDGPLRGEIERQIEREKLVGRVRIAGWMSGENVQAELDRSRVTVLSSYMEGLPVVLMESLAAGRPAIATHVSAIPELVVPGETGWLVPPGDAATLAAALREALDTPTDRLASMGRKGRDRVTAAHDAAHEASKLSELFTTLGGGL